jgi:hypothetical protein
MKHDVKYVQNAVILNGTTYTLEGALPATVWRLALEALSARLKRSTAPDETYIAIMERGVEPPPKKDKWVEAWANAGDMPYDEAMMRWEKYDRERRAQIRRHPEVHAKYHEGAAPLEELLK